MKILVIGSGGREHAIITALSKSAELHCAPGNGGIAKLATCHDVKATDIAGVITLAKSLSADYVFVAPDDPLVLGMIDALEESGFKTFGPRGNAAILEGSKAFSKDFMARHNIPTAKHAVFTDYCDAIRYVQSRNSYPAVIKYDGLALGKGVVIAEDEEQATAAIRAMLVQRKFGESGIVIEEYLEGVEVTVLAFTDGVSLVPMPASTDHKRAYDGDKGPNTGGMGVVTGVPYYTDEIAAECMERIFLPTIRGMSAEGRLFKGCLYFGLMLTAHGAKVIEYNCRFGDPEAQAILPLLETDLIDIIDAVHEGRLADLPVKFSHKKSACVVMASGGYPAQYEVGFPIEGLDCDSVLVYHSGTKVTPAGSVVTAGGRVLSVTAIAEDLQTALTRAYDGVRGISFKDAHYRTDIGVTAITRQ